MADIIGLAFQVNEFIMKKIILVNKRDKQIGTEEKIKAHREGKLHRAFSIFIFNSKGELLIQRRAKTKYHAPGLWANTCCSHPRPGKNLKTEAEKRLKEEMGIICNIKEVFSTIYNTKNEKYGGLFEHEFDHIFIGKSNANPNPDKEEVEDWKWIKTGELKKDIKKNPKKYASWFKLIMKKILNKKMVLKINQNI